MNSAMRFSSLGLALALVLSACGGNDSETTAIGPDGLATEITPFWSLTGLPGPEDAQIQPIVVVKIENDPVVRPQTGLDRADLIFEELVEGGMTRFAVVYQSDLPDEVGPVRSVRHVDVAIAEPIADAFVFSGGAKRTMKFVKRKIPTTISVVNEGAPGMYRKSDIPAPHNIFLKMYGKKISKPMRKLGHVNLLGDKGETLDHLLNKVDKLKSKLTVVPK